MNVSEEVLVGEAVANDYRTAQVFSNYGIDFCCRGNRTIAEVCDKNKVDQDRLLAELNEILNAQSGQDIDFNSWPMDLLVDYIEKTHHRYVEKQVPVLKAYLEKIRKVHGDQHPELANIETLFNASANELTTHMKKEELILFPQIKKMVKAKLKGEKMEKPPFGTVQNPIANMMAEHDNEGVRFREIAELSNNYTPPEDGCNTYRVAFSLVKEFEEDLHKHIHLENNILFKKASVLEQELAD